MSLASQSGDAAPARDALTASADDGLAAEVARRWHRIDPMLPDPKPLPPGCGTRFTVTGPGGGVQAAGSCEHWVGEPDSLDLTWGAASRFELTIQVGGTDVAGAVDILLRRWRRHLASLPAAAAADTAAVIHWPSRDVGGVAPLLRHGFSPLAVIAARRDAGRVAAAGASPPGVIVRRAAPDDLDAVVRLGLEVIRFDAHFGGVTERASTAGALRQEAGKLLADPQPWVWLAERDGAAIGMLAAERPELARWIAPMIRPDPVAYLLLMGVQSGERASGVGAAMAARLSAETADHHVPVTLLHYAQVNPLSAPFWSQQGYRPLWTGWEARSPGAAR